MSNEPDYCPNCFDRGLKTPLGIASVGKYHICQICPLCGYTTKPIQIRDVDNLPYKVKMVG